MKPLLLSFACGPHLKLVPSGPLAGGLATPRTVVEGRRGPLGEIPNCGVIAARPDPFVFELLDLVWSQDDLVDHPFWEQAALMRLCGFVSEGIDAESGLPSGGHRPGPPNRIWSRISALPDAWNSMDLAVVEDAVIEHYAGLPHDERLRRLGLARRPGAIPRRGARPRSARRRGSRDPA